MTPDQKRRANALAIAKQQTDTARANADVARAQAAAALAQADAARIQAAANAAAAQTATGEAERNRRAAEIAGQRQSRERARERLYQLGINIAAPVAGAGVGYVVARAYKAQTQKMVAAQAPQLKALAGQVGRLAPIAVGATRKAPLAAAKLAAIATTARRMRLTRGGPLGLAVGGVMLAEGAFSRFVLAPSLENPVAREAVSAVGTASLFAASMLVSKRSIQNRLMVPARNPIHVAQLETARRLTTGGGNIIQRMAAGQSLRQAISTAAGLRPAAPIMAAAPIAASAAAPAAATMARPMPRGVRAAAVVAGAAVALTLAARFQRANAGEAARGGATMAGAGAATAVAGAGSAPVPAATTSGSMVTVHSYMRRGGAGGSVRVSNYVRHLAGMGRRR